MIIKIQLPIVPKRTKRNPDPYRAPALIYDRKRAFVAQIEITPALEQIMNGTLKAFFHASLDENGELTIGEPAPWQHW